MKVEEHVGIMQVDQVADAQEPAPAEEAPRSTCLICMCEVPPNPSTQPGEVAEIARVSLECGHEFCKECIKQYVLVKVTDRQVEPDQLVCPSLDCKKSLSPLDLLQTTTEATFLKYARFIKLNEFERTPNVKWCPNVACEAVVKCKPNSSTFTCHECRTKGCAKCGNVSHPFQTCNMAMDKLYRAWEHAQRDLHQPIKPCPKCGYRIWKNDGCDHMTCVKCRHEWCWVCFIPWRFHNSHVCQVFRVLDSKYWGPCWPVRFFTKLVVIPIAMTVGVAGAAVVIAGGMIYTLVYLAPKAMVKSYKRWKRERHIIVIPPPNPFQLRLQRGLHVFIHSTDRSVSFQELLPTLCPGGGRWDETRHQYVQYASCRNKSFVSYLSHNGTQRLQETPAGCRVVLLHRAEFAFVQRKLLEFTNNEIGWIVFVVPTETLEEQTEADREVWDLVRRVNGTLLHVPNHHGDLTADYLQDVYEALFARFA